MVRVCTSQFHSHHEFLLQQNSHMYRRVSSHQEIYCRCNNGGLLLVLHASSLSFSLLWLRISTLLVFQKNSFIRTEYCSLLLHISLSAEGSATFPILPCSSAASYLSTGHLPRAHQVPENNNYISFISFSCSLISSQSQEDDSHVERETVCTIILCIRI